MQVILRDEVAHLGEVGDIVNVKAGYARNYLFPRGKAVMADTRQVKRVEHEKRVIESKVAKLRTDAQGRGDRLFGVKLKFQRAAGENDKLFGSVTSMDIEAMLKERGFEVSRREIQLSEHIKSLGEYDVPIKFHRDVVVTVNVKVEAKTE